MDNAHGKLRNGEPLTDQECKIHDEGLVTAAPAVAAPGKLGFSFSPLPASHLRMRRNSDRCSGVSPAVRQLFLFGLLLFLVSSRVFGAETPRVLILFSNDRLLPANVRYDEGIRQALDTQGKQTSVNLFYEFLDATRMSGGEREEAMAAYLERRYHGMPPQVLVALGPEALQFLIQRRNRLFPNVPLVFGGTGLDEIAAGSDLSGMVGLPMALDLKPVVESLLDLWPQTRELLLVHGSAAADRALRDIALRQCTPLADRLKVTDFPELPVEGLKSRLAGLSKGQAVLYLTYFQDPGGQTHTPAEIAKLIAASSSVPVVGTYDTYLGTGVLGVNVSTFEDEGLALGNLIRRLLDGEAPASIGIQPTRPTRLILDGKQLKRWGIHRVPAGAEVRFQPRSLWGEHPLGATVVVLLLIVQGGLIGGLLWSRARARRAENELRLSEERFAGIFRGSPVAISIIRQSDGHIIDVNPEWENTTGVAREDAIGRTPLEAGLVIDGDAEGRFRQFLQSGKLLEDFEQMQRTSDGQTRILSLTSEFFPLHDEACFIVVAKDVTGSRLEEDTRQKLALTSRLAMLGEMTASIAHEVNQPLGAILSNADAAELLLERAAPPLDEVRQILADIRRDDVRASEVIKRVRAMVGHRETHRLPVNLNNLVQETLKLIAREARHRGVALVHEAVPDLPIMSVDPVQIEQVILNFLLNAMDAMVQTPVVERVILVRITRADGGSVTVSVEDAGHGVPAEQLTRVFDSFFTTKENGMGLGLALSRSIAEAHGGLVSATNNASNGATFHLILPMNQVSP